MLESRCSTVEPKLTLFSKKKELREPAKNIDLINEQDCFIAQMVKSGKYQNASEAMRDAVRGLQQRVKTDELKLEILRAEVKAGLGALDHGALTEVDDTDLDTMFDLLRTN